MPKVTTEETIIDASEWWKGTAKILEEVTEVREDLGGDESKHVCFKHSYALILIGENGDLVARREIDVLTWNVINAMQDRLNDDNGGYDDY